MMPTLPIPGRRRAIPAALIALAAMATGATAQRPTPGAEPSSSIAARVAGLERRDGFLPLYLDAKNGKLLIELPHDTTSALFMTAQASGLGSNPVGIDRGADAGVNVIRFVRNGDRVLAIFENWSYRSSDSANVAHQRSIAESFPPSTVAALPLVAEEGNHLLIDATDLVMRDWTDVAATLANAKQGSYGVARDRSHVVSEYTKAFPDNSEIDVALTFALSSGTPGRIVEQMAPDGRSVTLRQHLSLVRLPDAGYTPREWDPRVGYFGITFKDYARPIQEPLTVHWIARHRLERVNPNDPNSPIRNPIVYYVDRGIPEPIRSATLEGVKWWEQAFDRAGLKGGFKAMLMPEGMDPMDSRYNVVQWENRNERGWSVGGALTDPRTGEMLKGMARLDSHRARTDYNIYAALMGAAPSPADTHFVLARVRQVSAHEVGHTLGLAHNYIASTYERGSVMDYPPPRVRVDANGNIDLSEAYAVGPGDYDVWAIHWGYGIFPAGTEKDSLKSIVQDGLKRGYLFLSDADARPEFGSDPRVSLWDDAKTPLEFLQQQAAARRIAIARFGERNIRPGQPIAALQERFVPLYFFHRFALNGVSKAIGGMEYANAVSGDAQQATRPVSYQQQLDALQMMLDELKPSELAVPDSVVTLLAPGANEVSPPVELFGSRTRPTFDELGAARTLAQMIVDMILQPDRAARLSAQAMRGGKQLTLSNTIDRLIAATITAPVPASAKYAALQRVTQRALVDRLMMLAANEDAAPEVRAMADLKLGQIRATAASRATPTASDELRAHWASIASDIGRWLEKHELPKFTPALVAPPGDPF